MERERRTDKARPTELSMAPRPRIGSTKQTGVPRVTNNSMITISLISSKMRMVKKDSLKRILHRPEMTRIVQMIKILLCKSKIEV